MTDTIQDRGADVKRSQHMAPGYVGTADKACAFVDEALAEIERLRAIIIEANNFWRHAIARMKEGQS